METRKMIVVNFLHYVKGYTVEQAEKSFIENKMHIDKVFDLIGDEILINILKGVNKKHGSKM